MKLIIVILFTIASIFSLFGKEQLVYDRADIIQIPQELSNKIYSGYLIRNISHKIHNLKKGESTDENENTILILYFDDFPSNDVLTKFEKHDVEFYLDSWIPPMSNHPYGFFIAKVPVSEFLNILIYEELILVASGEKKFYANNNRGYKAINADDVWTSGWDGSGVEVAVLDSGLDSYYDGTDMPSSYDKKDYSDYPTLDDNVENTHGRTGHGTHVTGTILGRGSYSSSNTGNGGGAYSGVAKGADLCFLKIEHDTNGGASSAAINGALQAAVSTYNSDLISMSYGGWSSYHDGSDSMCQQADWCYDQGIPVFMSTGNDVDDLRHYSATVAASSTTGYIEVTHNTSNRYFGFNLVWDDGTGQNIDLNISYYDSGYNPVTKYQYSYSESSRGTESRQTDTYDTQSAGTYYVTITNSSGSSQFFHLYELYGDGRSEFPSAIADPEYTCGSPAEADNVFAVGAWTTDRSWTAYDGSGYYFSSQTNNDICDFSNRGPRTDGVQKPQITAPGSAIISLRDTDVYTSASAYWVDDDGTTGDGTGDDHYYVMNGTSMSTPMCAGAAALFLDRYPTASPQDVYDALMNNAATDGYTGSVPNDIWGYGKLDIGAAIDDDPLPVVLSIFTAEYTSGNLVLSWTSQSESGNLGWNIYRGENENALMNEETIQINSNLIQGAGTTNQPTEYEFNDLSPVTPDNTYWYWIESYSNSGTTEMYGPVSIEVIYDGNNPEPPQNKYKYGLFQNYPNPFNPNTEISFKLRHSADAELIIFNLKGERIITLLDENIPASEMKTVMWNGKDKDGSSVSTGIYFYRLQIGKDIQTRKMLLIR